MARVPVIASKSDVPAGHAHVWDQIASSRGKVVGPFAVLLHRPELAWDAGKVVGALRGAGEAVPSVDALIAALSRHAGEGDHVVFMSNGGFEGAPRRFLAELGG